MAFPYCLEAARRHESGLQLSTEHREVVILGVIRQATPRWWKWPFNWFDICPLNRIADVFNIDWQHRNSAYLLLESYHCVHQFDIPREIRQRIPELIREALSSKVRMFCEIEEGAEAEIEEARDNESLRTQTRTSGSSILAARRQGRSRH